MSGPVALHGGGEFLAGDEPFLAALLDAAAPAAGGDRPIRVAVVPTAAARGRPGPRGGDTAWPRSNASPPGRRIDVAAAAIGVRRCTRARIRPGAGGLARRGRRHPLPGRRPGPHPDGDAGDRRLGGDHRRPCRRRGPGRGERGRDGPRVVDLDARRRDGRARWSCAGSSSCRTLDPATVDAHASSGSAAWAPEGLGALGLAETDRRRSRSRSPPGARRSAGASSARARSAGWPSRDGPTVIGTLGRGDRDAGHPGVMDGPSAGGSTRPSRSSTTARTAPARSRSWPSSAPCATGWRRSRSGS